MKLDSEIFLKLQSLLGKVDGLSLQSWIRTEQKNIAIGGAPKSWHKFGKAVDLEFDNLDVAIQAAKEAKALGFSGIEVDLMDNHIHVDTRTTKPWHVVITQDGDEIPLSHWLPEEV